MLFLAAVALAGGVMRVVRSAAPAPGASVIAPDLPAGDVAKQAQLARKALELARPLLPGERVDVDVATGPELERLPRVGPALARRIIDEREARGPFGSPDGLKRVSGIGPATLSGFERTATFSAGVRGAGSVPPLPVVVPTPSPIPPTPACRSTTLSLNRASAAQLACLPGIGPALAARIVTWRTAHGPFTEVQQLEQVPGIGPARLQRLAALLRLP